MNYPSKNFSNLSKWDHITPDMFEEKDYLTEVFLRSSFEPYINDLIKDAKSLNKAFSLVFMDLDRFKQINDKHGHPFGDEVLKYIGSSLRLTFRDNPCRIFRYGGDEFIIIFLERTANESLRLIRTLKYTLAHRPIIFNNKLFKITASYGIACFPSDGTEITDLIKKADIALYYSKNHGRNNVTIAEEVKSRKMINNILKGFCIFLCVFTLWIYRFPLIMYVNETAIMVGATVERLRGKDLDTIILKDGSFIQGQITDETNHSLTIKYKINNEMMNLFVDKSEIREKTYGKKTNSRQQFEEFLQNNPNPHVY